METLKVLLVEDYLLPAQVGTMLLSRLGCEVIHAITGEEAIEKFKQDHFDVIFMDLGLPGMDGFQATTAIRTLENQNNHVTIIALTAHTDDEYRQQALKSGMDDFLSKPLTSDKAKEIFARYIQQSQ